MTLTTTSLDTVSTIAPTPMPTTTAHDVLIEALEANPALLDDLINAMTSLDGGSLGSLALTIGDRYRRAAGVYEGLLYTARVEARFPHHFTIDFHAIQTEGRMIETIMLEACAIADLRKAGLYVE